MTRKKKKKPFFQTTVGQILKGAVGVVSPKLGDLLGSATSITESVKMIIEDNQLTPDQKEHFKNLAHELEIREFEAEVADRNSARNRQASANLAGSNDLLFNVTGFGITAAFLFMVAGALGFWDTSSLNEQMFYTVFGAVVTMETAVVAFFFGSSMGSKQKTNIMNGTQ